MFNVVKIKLADVSSVSSLSEQRCSDDLCSDEGAMLETSGNNQPYVDTFHISREALVMV